jgi:hypothetical protein
MSVYVDPLKEWGGSKEFRWKKSCHLFADTVGELHVFAEKLGMKREWFQVKHIPHYDLTERRRQYAVEMGAKEVSTKFLVEFVRQHRIARFPR